QQHRPPQGANDTRTTRAAASAIHAIASAVRARKRRSAVRAKATRSIAASAIAGPDQTAAATGLSSTGAYDQPRPSSDMQPMTIAAALRIDVGADFTRIHRTMRTG